MEGSVERTDYTKEELFVISTIAQMKARQVANPVWKHAYMDLAASAELVALLLQRTEVTIKESDSTPIE